MEEYYIRGVNSELIITLKKLLEAVKGQQQAVVDGLNEVSSAITAKLDTVISNQQEITITADTINLNTDTVEAKLEEIKDSVESMSASTSEGLTTIHTDITTLDSVVDTINEGVNNLKTQVEGINSNTDTLEALTEATNTKLDATQSSLNNISGAAQYLNPTHLAIVPAGSTTFEQNVVLCNITDGNITVTVTAADDTVAQSVVLTPGWNPVIIKSISDATANTLIYGW